MRIAVCINNVPDTSSKINVEADNKSISQKGLTFTLNPYDEFAIEEGLRTKEKSGGEVFVLNVGGESNKETIRKALAMGADEGLLIKSNQFELDSLTVAKLLAEEIKSRNSSIVFTGKQSVDYDNSAVGTMLGELLGFNSVSNVVAFSIDGETITAEREVEGGREVVKTTLPAVITCQKGINEPRYASLKGIMAAKKKVILEKEANVPESKIQYLSYKSPKAKSGGQILGADVTAVPELVKILKGAR
ncbi:MAG: electron transfer flavoprotein subunit beta/FixA family protein [Ignavibacteriales bacterium]|jgi:electron transfer flavoprotein beta subunit|nr:electron transfer flavoprotein subunit beta/FixA family protein [Ignavibacteriaceae bacterium]NLH61792.1 electron transfer flavoprotein subunit beta/FixA family protein [Ignavibacteriales bacterium]